MLADRQYNWHAFLRTLGTIDSLAIRLDQDVTNIADPHSNQHPDILAP